MCSSELKYKEHQGETNKEHLGTITVQENKSDLGEGQDKGAEQRSRSTETKAITEAHGQRHRGKVSETGRQEVIQNASFILQLQFACNFEAIRVVGREELYMDKMGYKLE